MQRSVAVRLKTKSAKGDLELWKSLVFKIRILSFENPPCPQESCAALAQAFTLVPHMASLK
jgi:hypothetical protein